MNVDEFLKHEVNRRQFLGSSAKNAAGVAAGMVGLSATVAKAAPSERLSLAVVGARNQGRKLAEQFAGFPDVDVAAVCDVDRGVMATAGASVDAIQGRCPRQEQDFRRIFDDTSIDAVVVATPDHWHAPMTVSACQAGKDVYVETPASHNLAEGERMVQAARLHERVIQTGMHQRSGTHFQSAIKFLQSGQLGPVNTAKAWIVHRRKSIGFKANAPAPKDVDYDMWLGPARKQPFNPNRFHANWHWFWDYGTGEIGNWGVHLLDIARWGLDVELPDRVSASGGKYHFNDDQQTPDTLVVNYSYPGKTIVWEHRLWTNHGIEGRSAAVAFYGENGTLIVDRGGWKVYGQKTPVTSDTSEQKLTHCRNFIDCIKTREQPTSDIETGHLSSALCHLGNIAYRVGHEITLDADRLSFGRDEQANALIAREYRKQWTLPVV